MRSTSFHLDLQRPFKSSNGWLLHWVGRLLQNLALRHALVPENLLSSIWIINISVPGLGNFEHLGIGDGPLIRRLDLPVARIGSHSQLMLLLVTIRELQRTQIARLVHVCGWSVMLWRISQLLQEFLVTDGAHGVFHKSQLLLREHLLQSCWISLSGLQIWRVAEMSFREVGRCSSWTSWWLQRVLDGGDLLVEHHVALTCSEIDVIARPQSRRTMP